MEKPLAETTPTAPPAPEGQPGAAVGGPQQQGQSSQQATREPSGPGARTYSRPFRGGQGGGRWSRPGFGRDFRPRRACRFCVEGKETLDYKDVLLLKNYVRERGKILAGRTRGTCARHQRKVRTAIKRARIMALIPFS